MLQLFDIYEDKDCKIVVSEYCNMGSLRSEIDRREGKGTDELRAIAILKQIVTALRVRNKLSRMFIGTAISCIRISRARIYSSKMAFIN